MSVLQLSCVTKIWSVFETGSLANANYVIKHSTCWNGCEFSYCKYTYYVYNLEGMSLFFKLFYQYQNYGEPKHLFYLELNFYLGLNLIIFPKLTQVILPLVFRH
jgi:hypothetical protein